MYTSPIILQHFFLLTWKQYNLITLSNSIAQINNSDHKTNFKNANQQHPKSL